MAAANNNLFRKATNNFSTTLGASIGATDTTISLTSTTNLPTDTAIDLVIDRVDINGNLTPSLREYVLGVVSSSDLITVLRGQGGSTTQAHATGAVVECVVTSETHNDQVSGILNQHNQDGSHGAITASSAAISGAVSANSVTINSGGTIDMSAATTTKYQPASITSPALANGAVTPAAWTNPYKFYAYLNSSQTTGTGGSGTAINLNAVSFDTNNNFSITNHAYTAPVAGYYHFDGNVGLSSNGAWNYVYINSAGSSSQSLNGASANDTSGTINSARSVSGILKLAAGDVVKLYVVCNLTGAGVITGTGWTRMSGYLISET